MINIPSVLNYFCKKGNVQLFDGLFNDGIKHVALGGIPLVALLNNDVLPILEENVRCIIALVSLRYMKQRELPLLECLNKKPLYFVHLFAMKLFRHTNDPSDYQNSLAILILAFLPSSMNEF